MATNLPQNLPELLNWCNTHSALFTENALQIGISPAQATLFKNQCEAMFAANIDAQKARQASKDATFELAEAVGDVRTTGGALVNFIKAYAETTGNNNVYALAGVSPNNPPSTLPAPVPPTLFSATINADGSLTIKWKVTQPQGLTGVQYIVSRRMIGEGAYTQVAIEGSNKSFTDTTLPVGIDKVEYIVQPKRGTQLGTQSNVFSVQFGSVSGGGGGMSISTIASTPHAEPVRIAA